MSAPDDPHEREADQIADRVLRMPDEQAAGERPWVTPRELAVQRKCKACEDDDEQSIVQRKATDAERPRRDAEPDEAVGRALASPGRPLDPSSRDYFERRFGTDFGRVRIHTDSPAARAATVLHARAFTVGADIAFGSAQYSPRSAAGRRLLAHELTHVVQQGHAPALHVAGSPLATPVAATPAVQRSPGDDPDLLQQLEEEKAAAQEDAGQDDDVMARAHGSRLAFLYMMFRHPTLTSQEVLDDFIDDMEERARTELDTLSREDNPYAPSYALEQIPEGFPLTWAARIRWRLSMGIDTAAVFEEWKASFDALKKSAESLGDDIFAHGLPVPLDDPSRLANFKLRIEDSKASNSTAIAGYAKESIAYIKLKWLSVFVVAWEQCVEDFATAVEDGDVIVDPDAYNDWVDNRAAKLQSLPELARERLAMTEEEVLQLETDAVSLDDAAVAIGMVSALMSIMGILSGWQDASGLFDGAIQKADGLVAGASGGDRLIAAMQWAWDNSYFSGAAAEWASSLIAHGPGILAEIAVILVLGMIPGVNVAVAVYLALTIARDVIHMINELGGAMNDCINATTVASLQLASMRLARVLTNGAIFILIVLVTEGIGKAAARLRKEAAELRAADKTLTEEAAQKKAMERLSAEERAALEQGPVKLAKKFEQEIGAACSLGSIVCRAKLPDHVEKEAGPYPSVASVPKPAGPFNVQKAALSGVQRGTENLRTIARQNRATWPDFDAALTAAEKAGKDWPVDAAGAPWEVHHVKPVFMGGTNAPGNLMPLPRSIHQQYTTWWNAVHRAFKRRFSETEWEQIYQQGKKVQGSRVPQNKVR